ncbi:MAG TPA: zeta toxin family protein [Streptosporangiaceae bacterium]|nr:zeta toxin family protein [Streptosporangiaceae bacterium]
MPSDKPPGPERPDQPESDKPDQPGSDKPDRPAEPGRPTDLGDRARNLPAGHPSADTRLPREADLPREAEPNDSAPTRADDIRPLTDAEYAEHVADVRDSLVKARVDGLATDQQHTIDPDNQRWSRERRHLHRTIVAELYAKAESVPCEGKAIVAGGLAGAGKTTVLADHADVDRAQYFTINPDDIKEELARRKLIPEIEGVSPMEASDLAHEESSHVAKQLARRAYSERRNVIWDITMSSQESTERRIDSLRNAGYERIDGIFVDIPLEVSLRRAEGRHREDQEKFRAGRGLGGRLVPPDVIKGQADPDWVSKNRKTFEGVKGKCDNWTVYDNSVDGRSPRRLEASEAPRDDSEPGRKPE